MLDRLYSFCCSFCYLYLIKYRSLFDKITLFLIEKERSFKLKVSNLINKNVIFSSVFKRRKRFTSEEDYGNSLYYV